MLSKSLVLLCFSVFLGAAQAQPKNGLYEKTFAGYTEYVSTKFGITVKFPEGFEDLHEYFVLKRVSENANSGSMYGPVFQSDDEECLILYPAIPYFQSKSDLERSRNLMQINNAMNNDTSSTDVEFNDYDTYARSQIESEIKATMGLVDKYGNTLWDSEGFNLNDHIRVISGEKAQSRFNADSVYLYKLPLDKPYREKYTHRLGMVLYKKDRAKMLFKWFFTEKGKLNQETYLDLIWNTITYKEEFEYEE